MALIPLTYKLDWYDPSQPGGNISTLNNNANTTTTYDTQYAMQDIIDTVTAEGIIPWPYQYTVGDFNFLQGENPAATGLNNTALGVGAATALTTGQHNTLMGAEAGIDLLDGSTNTGIGYRSLYKLTDGGDNTGVGYYSLFNLQTTASNNTAVGFQCNWLNVSGEYNTSVGSQCMRALNSGDNNTAVGYYAMAENSAGSNNVAIGRYAAQRMTSGAPDYVVCVGVEAADDWNLGKHNTVIGGQAGAIASPQSLGAGIENVLLGYQAATLTGTDDNSIVIGANARGNGTNSITIGNTTNTGLSLPGSLLAFDDDAAAGVGGLTINMLYQTTGAGAAPLNAAGIVMMKQ